MSTDTNLATPANGAGAASDTLTVTDNRTGRTYEIPIAPSSMPIGWASWRNPCMKPFTFS